MASYSFSLDDHQSPVRTPVSVNRTVNLNEIADDRYRIPHIHSNQSNFSETVSLCVNTSSSSPVNDGTCYSLYSSNPLAQEDAHGSDSYIKQAVIPQKNSPNDSLTHTFKQNAVTQLCNDGKRFYDIILTQHNSYANEHGEEYKKRMASQMRTESQRQALKKCPSISMPCETLLRVFFTVDLPVGMPLLKKAIPVHLRTLYDMGVPEDHVNKLKDLCISCLNPLNSDVHRMVKELIMLNDRDIVITPTVSGDALTETDKEINVNTGNTHKEFVAWVTIDFLRAEDNSDEPLEPVHFYMVIDGEKCQDFAVWEDDTPSRFDTQKGITHSDVYINDNVYSTMGAPNQPKVNLNTKVGQMLRAADSILKELRSSYVIPGREQHITGTEQRTSDVQLSQADVVQALMDFSVLCQRSVAYLHQDLESAKLKVSVILSNNTGDTMQIKDKAEKEDLMNEAEMYSEEKSKETSPMKSVRKELASAQSSIATLEQQGREIGEILIEQAHNNRNDTVTVSDKGVHQIESNLSGKTDIKNTVENDDAAVLKIPQFYLDQQAALEKEIEILKVALNKEKRKIECLESTVYSDESIASDVNSKLIERFDSEQAGPVSPETDERKSNRSKLSFLLPPTDNDVSPKKDSRSHSPSLGGVVSPTFANNDSEDVYRNKRLCSPSRKDIIDNMKAQESYSSTGSRRILSPEQSVQLSSENGQESHITQHIMKDNMLTETTDYYGNNISTTTTEKDIQNGTVTTEIELNDVPIKVSIVVSVTDDDSNNNNETRNVTECYYDGKPLLVSDVSERVRTVEQGEHHYSTTVSTRPPSLRDGHTEISPVYDMNRSSQMNRHSSPIMSPSLNNIHSPTKNNYHFNHVTDSISSGGVTGNNNNNQMLNDRSPNVFFGEDHSNYQLNHQSVNKMGQWTNDSNTTNTTTPSSYNIKYVNDSTTYSTKHLPSSTVKGIEVSGINDTNDMSVAHKSMSFQAGGVGTPMSGVETHYSPPEYNADVKECNKALNKSPKDEYLDIHTLTHEEQILDLNRNNKFEGRIVSNDHTQSSLSHLSQRQRQSNHYVIPYDAQQDHSLCDYLVGFSHDYDQSKPTISYHLSSPSVVRHNRPGTYDIPEPETTTTQIFLEGTTGEKVIAALHVHQRANINKKREALSERQRAARDSKHHGSEMRSKERKIR